jgi:3-keto-5-aminohexanoate cleavage enzyme
MRRWEMERIAKKRIIVGVAPVGVNIEPPSFNPLSPEEVANEVVNCAKAGASMVHLHVRDNEGNQTEDLGVFSKTLELIRKDSDIILQGSTGGLSTLSLEERCVSLNDPRVEVASLNMGSANFGEQVYINTLPDIRYWARRMADKNIVPELEVFEGGMMENVPLLVKEEVLSRPFYYNFCVGFPGALPAKPASLFMLCSAHPSDTPWGLIHHHMHDFSFLGFAVAMGASMIRVGFEDSVHFAPGEVAATNLVVVEKVVAFVRSMGCDIATPSEARGILGVPPPP